MDRLTSFLHYKEQKLYLKFGLKKIYGSNPPNSDAIVSFKKWGIESASREYFF